MRLAAQGQTLQSGFRQNPKPKGCENGKRRAKRGNRCGKDNMHLSFSTSCIALPKSGHIKTFFPLEPDKTWTKNGGGNRTRTGESRFCRPLPYHLAMPPYGAGNGI